MRVDGTRNPGKHLVICAKHIAAIPSAERCAQSKILLRAVEKVLQACEEGIAAQKAPFQSLQFEEIRLGTA